MADSLEQWVDAIDELLNSKTATYEQYLQMDKAFRNYINQRNAKEGINLWSKLWSGPVDMFYMILEGIQFENAEYNILDTIDAGKKVSNDMELFGQDLEGLLRKMKKDGLITENEQITSKGKRFLEENTLIK